MENTRETGKFAEDLACRYLQKQGMTLLSRNFNSRYGEIDLVMQDTDSLVFVEVRYRNTHGLVDGIASVNTGKQQKLIRTAQYYLQQNKVGIDTNARFDIISVTHKHNQPEISWLKNAFTA